ncbi:hypothetical protein MNJPNG_25320 [Cupriavidus oxalaticus]|uniref:hypothetical protein n=1 Tax=Cupriavidus oxalaticus TaxID=96344 RepID=UPI003F738FB5
MAPGFGSPGLRDFGLAVCLGNVAASKCLHLLICIKSPTHQKLKQLLLSAKVTKHISEHQST